MLLKAATKVFNFSWAASSAGIIFEADIQFIIIVVFAEIDCIILKDDGTGFQSLLPPKSFLRPC